MGPNSNGRSRQRSRVRHALAVNDRAILEDHGDEGWVPVLIPASALSHVGQFLRVSLTGDVSESLGVVPSEKRDSALEERCRDLAESRGLSARESEVLACIARGRNAQYLEKRLGISISTAKTHIAHVYRKLGVSSQQALLDLVEQEPDRRPTSRIRPVISAMPAAHEQAS